jgi:chemotaxis protein CheD
VCWAPLFQSSKLVEFEVERVTIPTHSGNPASSATVSVAIGQWAVATAPVKIQTLLGSCVGVVLYDRVARVGGLAHIVLPSSRGSADHPGKFADTAVPAMIVEIERQLKAQARGRLVAKLLGGASMFPTGDQSNPALNIGQMNQEAVEQILGEMRIPIVARDLGGGCGRHLTLDTASGIVGIRVPGGASYEL